MRIFSKKEERKEQKEKERDRGTDREREKHWSFVIGYIILVVKTVINYRRVYFCY